MLKGLLLKDGEGKFIELDNSLPAIRNIIGGYTECLRGNPEGYVVLCDESGLEKELPPTCIVMYGRYAGTQLGGTVLVLGQTGSAFSDIPEKVAENWTRYFRLCK